MSPSDPYELHCSDHAPLECHYHTWGQLGPQVTSTGTPRLPALRLPPWHRYQDDGGDAAPGAVKMLRCATRQAQSDRPSCSSSSSFSSSWSSSWLPHTLAARERAPHLYLHPAMLLFDYCDRCQRRIPLLESCRQIALCLLSVAPACNKAIFSCPDHLGGWDLTPRSHLGHLICFQDTTRRDKLKKDLN